MKVLACAGFGATRVPIAAAIAGAGSITGGGGGAVGKGSLDQGASSFGESNPLQRIWRDAETGSRHAILNPEVATEIYGQSLLGIRGAVSELV